VGVCVRTEASQPASQQDSRPGSQQANKQASKPASKPASKEARKPASKQARLGTAGLGPDEGQIVSARLVIWQSGQVLPDSLRLANRPVFCASSSCTDLLSIPFFCNNMGATERE